MLLRYEMMAIARSSLSRLISGRDNLARETYRQAHRTSIVSIYDHLLIYVIYYIISGNQRPTRVSYFVCVRKKKTPQHFRVTALDTNYVRE